MNHTHLTRALSLCLAVMMLLCTLAACGQTDENDGDGSATEASTAAEVETEDPAYVCDLPEDLDFKGEPIHILYANKVGRDDELPAEKLGLGIISDAVYDRNLTVEDMLKIKLDYIPVNESDIVASHNKDVQGGTGAYDIVVNGVYMAIDPATQGKYIDLSPLEYVDTSKHYWAQGFNDISFFTSENRQYLATGAAALSTYRLMYLTIYNKTLFESNHKPDLYDVVMNGEWTLEYQLGILSEHYVDTDGNGKKSKGDSFGLITGNCVSTDPYLAAGNVFLVVRDPDLGELAINTDAKELLFDLVPKVQAIYNNSGTYVYNSSAEDDVGLSNIVENFAEGRSLMATLIFWNMEHSYSELANLSYGIAPMPKLTVEQKDYHSYVQDQVSTFGVSASVASEDRREMLGAVLEALMYHSYRIVRPAYYETSLSYKYMQDEQSKEILDVVCDSMAFDFAEECCGLVGYTRTLFSGSKNTAASAYKSWENLLKAKLKGYNTSIGRLKK